MAQTYETGYKSTLTAKLTAAATTMSLATCPTVTSGRIHLKSATQEEWVSFTGNSNPGGAGNLTGLTRGLSQTADPATSGTGSVWLAGQEVELVAMHDQFIDKNEATTMKNTLSFSNTSVSGLRVQSLTTAQRTALTPTNGEIVYDSDLGLLYSYQAGSWTSLDTGTNTPNASATVAGKVEEADSTERDNATETGATGAQLFMNPKQIAQSVQDGLYATVDSPAGTDTYTGTLVGKTAYTEGTFIRFTPPNTNTGASTLNLNSIGARSIITRSGNALLAGDLVTSEEVLLYDNGSAFILMTPIPANTAEKGLVERATDAEVTTGTDTTRYVTPNQLPKVNIVQFQRVLDAGNGTVNVAHGLSRTPKYAILMAEYADTNVHASSNGFWDGTNNGSSRSFYNAGVSGSSGNSSSLCIYISDTASSGDSASITAVDGTNITFTWSVIGSPGNVTANITCLVFA